VKNRERIGIVLIASALLIRTMYLAAKMGLPIGKIEIVAIILFSLGIGLLLQPVFENEE